MPMLAPLGVSPRGLVDSRSKSSGSGRDWPTRRRTRMGKASTARTVTGNSALAVRLAMDLRAATGITGWIVPSRLLAGKVRKPPYWYNVSLVSFRVSINNRSCYDMRPEGYRVRGRCRTFSSSATSQLFPEIETTCVDRGPLLTREPLAYSIQSHA